MATTTCRPAAWPDPLCPRDPAIMAVLELARSHTLSYHFSHSYPRLTIPHHQPLAVMSDESQRWIRGFRENDDSAVVDFWSRYEERLRRLAERNLSDRMKRRIDADDVVQSAFRTFLRRAGQDEFELRDRQNLLSLLTTITLNKIRQKVRHFAAQKRGGDSDQYFETMADLGGDTPTPDEEAALREIEELLRGFDEEQQQVVDLKLQNHTNEEIARRMQCSERTVRRMIKRVEQNFEKLIREDDQSSE